MRRVGTALIAQATRAVPTGRSARFARDLPCRAAEADRAWRNYIGYWGTFSVDPKAGIVVHQIEGGWFPNWISQKQVRSFRFERESLVLEADSPAWHTTLIWRRID
jgi:hypothetical protein